MFSKHPQLKERTANVLLMNRKSSFMFKNVKPSSGNVNFTCPQSGKEVLFMPVLVGDRWPTFSKYDIVLASELV